MISDEIKKVELKKKSTTIGIIIKTVIRNIFLYFWIKNENVESIFRESIFDSTLIR